MTSLEIYWSFRSPYSYLAVNRLQKIIDQYNVEADFRIVRPLALREDGFFKNARPQFVPYLVKDMLREGQRLGVPIKFPNPDPIIMDLGTGEVAEDQPYITRLMALGIAAVEKGQGFAFAKAVSARIWAGIEGWDKPPHLSEAASEAGLVLSDLEDWAAANEGHISAAIARNESAQMKHHWGVPLMVLNNEESFFGQDRLDALEWRLQQIG